MAEDLEESRIAGLLKALTLYKRTRRDNLSYLIMTSLEKVRKTI